MGLGKNSFDHPGGLVVIHKLGPLLLLPLCIACGGGTDGTVAPRTTPPPTTPPV